MWDWSKRIFNKPSSLILAYKDLAKAQSTPKRTKQIHKETRELIEEKIHELGLKNISLIEKSYDPQNWQEMNRGFMDYHRARGAFLKLLGYSHTKECKKLGLSTKDIDLLKEGIAPENYNTHLKVPFDFGGSIDFGNLSLVKSHPTHDYLHSLIDLQIERGLLVENKKILIPWFEGRVYYD